MSARRWRVGEFRSSAYPGTVVLCISEGDRIAYDEGHHSFIRWIAGSDIGAGEPAGFGTFRDGRFGSWLFQTRAMAESHDSTAVAGGPGNSEIVPLFRHPAQAVPDELPAFLRWCADELVKRDHRAGSFAQGVADSLKGRAYILESVDAKRAQAGAP